MVGSDALKFVGFVVAGLQDVDAMPRRAQGGPSMVQFGSGYCSETPYASILNGNNQGSQSRAACSAVCMADRQCTFFSYAGHVPIVGGASCARYNGATCHLVYDLGSSVTYHYPASPALPPPTGICAFDHDAYGGQPNSQKWNLGQNGWASGEPCVEAQCTVDGSPRVPWCTRQNSGYSSHVYGQANWGYCRSCPPPPPPPIDCVGSWSDWSDCSAICEGTKDRLFSITTREANGGRRCTSEDGATRQSNCGIARCPLPTKPIQDNSCNYAHDGDCDEPTYCYVGTDCDDCQTCNGH
jgi:hypothetical protein